MPESFDIVVAGAGHNSLIAAAYLSRAGYRCVVLEGRAVAGGDCVTEELTLPGFRHDTCASAHVVLQDSPMLRNDELRLADYGLEYIFPEAVVQIHRQDAEMLAQPVANLSTMSGLSFTTKPADVLLEDGDTVWGAGTELQVIHTPGHTPGGICLYAAVEETVFVGDTLFADSIGRTDLPGGSTVQLVGSIAARLLTLPDVTKVYPGHGPETTIGRERTHNQYLRQGQRENP